MDSAMYRKNEFGQGCLFQCLYIGEFFILGKVRYMAKQLFNFAYVPQSPLPGLENEDKLREFLKEQHLDGVEMMNYDSSLDLTAFARETVGVHLKYWPCWLAFFRQDTAVLKKYFPGNALRKYYGASDLATWKASIRENISTALALKPEYLVWHVAESTPEEAFTFKFSHTNKEVLQATLALYEEVFCEVPHSVTVLFENLWWPGLTLLEPEEINWFFSQLQGKNVGIMLDTGHLLNTAADVATEEEAVAYLVKRVQALGELKALIKGLHLNLSLSAAYRRQEHAYTHPCSEAEMLHHIASIDQHRAFTGAKVQKLLALVEPKYINHELYFKNSNELALLLQKQMQI